jgi:dienelactone hydrolase
MACGKPVPPSAGCWLRRINKIIFVVAPPPEGSFNSTACGKPGRYLQFLQQRMRVTKAIIIISLLISWSIRNLHAQEPISPDTVVVISGKLALKGLLWYPAGTGPFPTVIFCHGSYGGSDTVHDPLQQVSLLGPVFAKRGYIFLGLFRRGVGLSQEEGLNSAVLMEDAFKESGQEGRNKVQLQQMENDQLQDMVSGLKFLRNRTDVDSNRMTVVGHSFGGSLALIVAEYDPKLKAVIIFSGGGYSWDRSSQLRSRLTSAIKKIDAPVMIIHAQNDYSLNPGYALDSIRKQEHKPCLLKIYPKIGNTKRDGHNLIFQSIETWEADVFAFLSKSFQR